MWSPGMRFATEAVKMLGRSCFDENGTLAFGLGGIVDAFGFFALADHAADDAIAYADFQVIYDAVVRQRKNIDGLDGLGAGVHVLLRDRGRGCQTTHVDSDVGMNQRDGFEAAGDG